MGFFDWQATCKSIITRRFKMITLTETRPQLVHHDVAIPKSPEPKVALIFFRSAQGGFITRHDVTLQTGGPVIGPGTMLSPNHAKNLVKAFNKKKTKDKDSRPTVLPENIISITDQSLTWICEGQVAPMWIRLQGRAFKFTVPWPTLLYHVSKEKGLRLAALKRTGRPQADTRLYVPPLMNTNTGNGSVCLGSASIKPSAELQDRMKAWEDAVMKSTFSHFWDSKKVIKYPKGRTANETEYLRFWKTLEREVTQRFPNNRLISMNMGLEKFLSL